MTWLETYITNCVDLARQAAKRGNWDEVVKNLDAATNVLKIENEKAKEKK